MKMENKITIILELNNKNKDIINSFINDESIKIYRSDNVERNILIVLKELGMPSNLHGYRYVKEAIKLCINNYDYLHPNMLLYPVLSKKFNVNNWMIEKSIRDAITITWNKGNYEYQNELFGYTIDKDKGKPTNGEFIAQIVNYLSTI